MKFKSVFLLFLLCLCSSRFLVGQTRFVSVQDFGVDGIERRMESQDDKYNRFIKIKSAFEYAVKTKQNLFFPKGVYDVGNRNFPFRTSENVRNNKLLDCKGITIFGEKGTVFKTTSEYGADVLQLNKVKNITFKNLEITAELIHSTRSGSNGISITNGFDNIGLENIFIYDLPGVDYGSYIDGGKGLTIQIAGGNKAYKGNVVAKNIKVRNCAYGFRFDGKHVSDVLDFSNRISLAIDIQVEKAFQGVSIEFGEANKKVDTKKELNIRINASLDNCQQYVRFARVFGGEYNISVKKSENKSTKVWNKQDRRRIVLIGNYVKNAKVNIQGEAGDVDEKFMIGAVGSIIEPFGLKNRTENVTFNLDVRGNSKNTDFHVIEYKGDSITGSNINVSKRTLDKNTNLGFLGNYNKLLVR